METKTNSSYLTEPKGQTVTAHTFVIHDTRPTSAQPVIGTFQGADEDEALDAMARTLGYDDYFDLWDTDPALDAAIWIGRTPARAQGAS